jgi:hypothetical protein
MDRRGSRDIGVVIVGAGPYGLSVSAHLAHAGVSHRIFGTPMRTWRECMPDGMFLRSEGFASNLSHPSGELGFERYRAARGLTVGEWCNPIPLDVYRDYATWFVDEARIPVEDARLERLVRVGDRFALTFADGEVVHAVRVVLAVGLTHFTHVPRELASLPDDVRSHSSAPIKPRDAHGREIVVVGAGQSALETAALLHEQGADVHVVARSPALSWHRLPPPLVRPLTERARAPIGGLGIGWSSWAAEHLPWVFRRLPARRRVEIVARTFGPAGAWWLRDRVEGHVTVHVGRSLRSAALRGDRPVLELDGPDGVETIAGDHVVAATGYRVDVSRLPFLDDDLRSSIRLTAQSPSLSAGFESSVPRLHFVGAPAASTFGPLMRFVLGARHAARAVTRVATRAR